MRKRSSNHSGPPVISSREPYYVLLFLASGLEVQLMLFSNPFQCIYLDTSNLSICSSSISSLDGISKPQFLQSTNEYLKISTSQKSPPLKPPFPHPRLQTPLINDPHLLLLRTSNQRKILVTKTLSSSSLALHHHPSSLIISLSSITIFPTRL